MGMATDGTHKIAFLAARVAMFQVVEGNGKGRALRDAWMDQLQAAGITRWPILGLPV